MGYIEGKKVVVFGATGSQGAPVARRLLQRGARVRALTRSRAKSEVSVLEGSGAEIVQFDFRDAGSAVRACEGADAAFLVFSASVTDDEWLSHARNALHAVRDVHVPRVVLTTSTIVPAARVGISRPDAKVELLELVRELCPGATILSPTFFLENFSTALRQAILGGVIPQALPETVPVRYLSLDDQAAFVLEAFERPELAGQYLRIGGAEETTGPQLAAHFESALGRSVVYRALPPAAFRAQLVPFLGEAVSDSLTGMLTYAGAEGAALLSPDLAPTHSALHSTHTTEAVASWAKRAFA